MRSKPPTRKAPAGGNSADRRQLRQVPFSKILKVLHRHRGIERRGSAQAFTEKARAIIGEFPASPYQRALMAGGIGYYARGPRRASSALWESSSRTFRRASEPDSVYRAILPRLGARDRLALPQRKP
jgi:hypothetical protein